MRSLKAQAAELDRKIALTLSPSEEEKENLEKEVQETRYVATSTSLKDAGETSLSDPTSKPMVAYYSFVRKSMRCYENEMTGNTVSPDHLVELK